MKRVHLRLEDRPVFAPERSQLRDVDPRLAPYVANIEHYRERFTTPLEETVLPDGPVRLLFDLETKRRCIIGVADQPVRLQLHGNISQLTVTLRPALPHELLGIPSRELRNQFIPLEVGDLNRELLTWTTRPSTDRRRVRHAMESLKTNHVRETARELQLSERRLQQLRRRTRPLAALLAATHARSRGVTEPRLR